VVAVVVVRAPWQALVVAALVAALVAAVAALVVAALVVAALVVAALGPADVMQTCSWNSFFWLRCDFNMITQKK
jgi:hypothetical protein